MKSWKRFAAIGLIAAAAPVCNADEVTHWNDVMLDLYRLDFGTGCPCPLARAGAITHIAVFEAINSIERTHTPYRAYIPAASSASKEAAVSAAAFRAMSVLFPGSITPLTNEYNARLALIPDGAPKTAGIAVGIAAADQILAEREDDGSLIDTPYTYGTAPGDYVPTPPSFNPECNPQWGQVASFSGVDVRQYVPAGPLGFTSMAALIQSPAYAAQVNAVKAYGARFSTVRTAEQTKIAFFWANDVNGTYKPPGHLFDITRVVSEDHALSLSQNARLFALVAISMGDAGIAAWHAKWSTDIDLWRPVSAIRSAANDGNPGTIADPNWESINPFSPPFPAWISGHATFGAAHAGVMAEFFGTDSVTFTCDSEDPFYNALPESGPRTFNSFAEAAIENGVSRVYLGVHFPFDASDGNAAGFAIGHMVGQSLFLPVCRADFNSDGFSNSQDFFDFITAFFAQSPASDFNRDGINNSQDFFDFLTTFFVGC